MIFGRAERKRQTLRKLKAVADFRRGSSGRGWGTQRARGFGERSRWRVIGVGIEVELAVGTGKG